MNRISGANFAVASGASPLVAPAGAAVFQDLNLGTNTPGTYPNALWFTGAQESIMAVLAAAGIVPADTDNTQLLAAIVSLLGGRAGFTALTASTVLTAAMANHVVQATGAGPWTFTLPAGATMRAGSTLCILNQSSAPLTIATQGADIVCALGNVQPVTMQMGDTLVLINRAGSTEWDIAGGTVAAQFVQSPRLAPQVVTSGQGIAIGANYSVTLSATFTAPSAGTVLAFSGFNPVPTSTTLAANVVNNLEINGTALQADSIPFSQSHHTALAVAAGTAVSVTLTVTTSTSPNCNATYHVGYIFVPGT